MDTVMKTDMDAERLAAFVDGELSPEDAAAVVLHLADCPRDRAHVDALMEVGTLFAAAYSEPLHQAVPERLRAVLDPTPPLAAPPRRTARRAGRSAFTPRRAVSWGVVAMAASALLAIGLTLRPDPAAPQLGVGPIAPGSAFHAALEGAASGQADDEVTLIATFRDQDGRPCREFEARGAGTAPMVHGIACRNGAEGWTAIAAITAEQIETPLQRQAFIPAGGAEAGDLDAVLDRIGAGMTLTPAEEASLIARGWQN